MELTWPGVPVTAWASMRPSVSNTPAERSPASRTEVENAVRTKVCACSSTTAMSRLHMICAWICDSAALDLSSIMRLLSVARRSHPSRRPLTRPPQGEVPSFPHGEEPAKRASRTMSRAAAPSPLSLITPLEANIPETIDALYDVMKSLAA